MVKRIALLAVSAVLMFGFYKSSDFTLITAGVAIFMLGMIFMEGGFKAFSGGILEAILKKTTSTLPKAIFSGFAATSIVQSSSLISVITISFLSAELLGLYQAIGIVFGANIGTTTTAWLVSAFGLKIKISHFALPMLVFGVLLKFTKSKSSQGIGNILLGLGLLFLGIGDMKEGFETFKESFDLSQYAMQGFAGLIVYVLIGIAITVIIQSSSATMAIVITALATGQITYENSLALAIGSNIGTTITAILGSLTSNANGKRLALAHLIFNLQTGLVAIIFLPAFVYVVSFLSKIIGIGATDYAMQLSLFHTIFNIIGVAIMLPFMKILVKFLSSKFTKDEEQIEKPLYLSDEFIKIPTAALEVLEKETFHLLDNAYVILSHGINVHRSDIYSNKDIAEMIKTSAKDLPLDIEEMYEKRIKTLYNEIVYYAIHSQDFMDEEKRQKAYNIIMANRFIAEAVKEIGLIQKNIDIYTAHQNEFIKKSYNALRENLIKILREVYKFKNENYRDIAAFEMLKVYLKEFDMATSNSFFELISNGKIDNEMATSLMNDSAYIKKIAEDLISFSKLMWFEGGPSLEEKDIIDIASNN